LVFIFQFINISFGTRLDVFLKSRPNAMIWFQTASPVKQSARLDAFEVKASKRVSKINRVSTRGLFHWGRVRSLRFARRLDAFQTRFYSKNIYMGIYRKSFTLRKPLIYLLQFDQIKPFFLPWMKNYTDRLYSLKKHRKNMAEQCH